MKYAKFIVAGAVAGLTALVSALTDNTVTTQEWAVIALTATGAIGVYFAPRHPSE